MVDRSCFIAQGRSRLGAALRRDAFLIKRLWLRVRRHGKNRWVNRQAVWWGNPTTGFWKRGSRTSSCVFASISFIVKLKVGPTNSSSRIIITELLLVEDARNPPISGPNALRWTAMPLVPVVVLLPILGTPQTDRETQKTACANQDSLRGRFWHTSSF
jgi:hypothetical protein